ncbi:MAG: hypothetical protein ACFHU9_17525 [Fluviicola sp.]
MKTFLAATFILIGLSSHSQIVPKSRFIGGDVTAFYRSRAILNWEEIGAGIRPQFGKFINEKWSFEVGANYYFHQLKIRDQFEGFLETQRHTTTLGVNFGFTRYFELSDQFYFTLSAGASADNIYTRNLLPDFPSETRMPIEAGIRPGLIYFLNPKWMLSANFGALKYSAWFNNVETPDIYFGFDFSSYASGIGVNYIIEPRKKRVKN